MDPGPGSLRIRRLAIPAYRRSCTFGGVLPDPPAVLGGPRADARALFGQLLIVTVLLPLREPALKPLLLPEPLARGEGHCARTNMCPYGRLRFHMNRQVSVKAVAGIFRTPGA